MEAENISKILGKINIGPIDINKIISFIIGILKKDRPKGPYLMSEKTLCMRAVLRENDYLAQKNNKYIIKTAIVCSSISILNYFIIKLLEHFDIWSALNIIVPIIICAILHIIIGVSLHVNFKNNIIGYRIFHLSSKNTGTDKKVIEYLKEYKRLSITLNLFFITIDLGNILKYCTDDIFLMLKISILFILAVIMLYLFHKAYKRKKDYILKIDLIDSKKLIPRENEVDGKNGFVYKKTSSVTEIPINLFESNISEVEDGHILIEYKTGDSEIIDKKDIEYIAIYKGKNRNFEIVYKDCQWIQQPKNNKKESNNEKKKPVCISVAIIFLGFATVTTLGFGILALGNSLYK